MALFEMTAASAYLPWFIVCIVSILALLCLAASVFYLLQHNRKRAGESAEAIQEAHAQLQASRVMRDVTEEKRQGDVLAELASNDSESNHRMSEFLAKLAHELRNPLAPIRNALDLMGMSSLSHENEELRLLLDRQVSKLVHLLDDVLDLSQIWRGEVLLQRQVVDLKSVVEGAVETSRAAIQEKSQILTIEFCEEEAMVNVDPARITHVVANLLSNASQYNDSGCVIKLSVSVDLNPDEHGVAMVRVEDNGIGISRDRLGDVFQMHALAENSLERRQSGLGIGLTLVKTFVELHHGTVEAHSDGLGKGSVFTVRLPMAKSAGEAPLEEPPKEWPIGKRTYQVLVVEDIRALRTMMARLLEKLGHRVQVAEDGLSALESIARITPEVIFSDISMPGMTGYDLAKKIRSHPGGSDIYLVAMSGYGQLSDRVTSKESGFNEHMVKPIEISQLKDFFERLSR